MVDGPLDDSIAQHKAGKRKFRVGLTLFAVYIVVYALFTLAGTFFRDVLTIRVGGLNLGVVSGMLIILSAIVIAVLYNWFAGKAEES
jgi:uncharacterized membrane protein (DUF485 family)